MQLRKQLYMYLQKKQEKIVTLSHLRSKAASCTTFEHGYHMISTLKLATKTTLYLVILAEFVQEVFWMIFIMDLKVGLPMVTRSACPWLPGLTLIMLLIVTKVQLAL